MGAGQQKLHGRADSICRKVWTSTSRVILIGESFLDQIVHVPKLFSLLHWSQNIFCFLCSSIPSHVGKFFRLQWEFQWENDQNKKWPKITFPGSKMVPKVSKWGF